MRVEAGFQIQGDKERAILTGTEVDKWLRKAGRRERVIAKDVGFLFELTKMF